MGRASTRQNRQQANAQKRREAKLGEMYEEIHAFLDTHDTLKDLHLLRQACHVAGLRHIEDKVPFENGTSLSACLDPLIYRLLHQGRPKRNEHSVASQYLIILVKVSKSADEDLALLCNRIDEVVRSRERGRQRTRGNRTSSPARTRWGTTEKWTIQHIRANLNGRITLEIGVGGVLFVIALLCWKGGYSFVTVILGGGAILLIIRGSTALFSSSPQNSIVDQPQETVVSPSPSVKQRVKTESRQAKNAASEKARQGETSVDGEKQKESKGQKSALSQQSTMHTIRRRTMPGQGKNYAKRIAIAVAPAAAKFLPPMNREMNTTQASRPLPGRQSQNDHMTMTATLPRHEMPDGQEQNECIVAPHGATAHNEIQPEPVDSASSLSPHSNQWHEASTNGHPSLLHNTTNTDEMFPDREGAATAKVYEDEQAQSNLPHEDVEVREDGQDGLTDEPSEHNETQTEQLDDNERISASERNHEDIIPEEDYHPHETIILEDSPPATQETTAADEQVEIEAAPYEKTDDDGIIPDIDTEREETDHQHPQPTIEEWDQFDDEETVMYPEPKLLHTQPHLFPVLDEMDAASDTEKPTETALPNRQRIPMLTFSERQVYRVLLERFPLPEYVIVPKQMVSTILPAKPLRLSLTKAERFVYYKQRAQVSFVVLNSYYQPELVVDIVRSKTTDYQVTKMAIFAKVSITFFNVELRNSVSYREQLLEQLDAQQPTADENEVSE